MGKVGAVAEGALRAGAQNRGLPGFRENRGHGEALGFLVGVPAHDPPMLK